MSHRRDRGARRLRLEMLESRLALTTFYVAPTGNDGQSGTDSAPWQTLQRAANSVQAGDTVIVRPGNYAGFDLRRDGAAGQPITFRAEPGAAISQRNPRTPDGINLEAADYVIVEGFTINGMPRSGIRAVENHHVVIRNNSLDQNARWGILTGFSDDVVIEGNVASRSQLEHGIYVSNSGDRPIIRNNTVWGNRANGIHMNGDASLGGDGIITGALVEGNVLFGNGAGGGSAINGDGVQNSTIRNNLIYDTHASGISLYRIDGGGGSTGNLVVNNTVLVAADGRWALNIQDGSTDNTVRNNILVSQHSFRGAIDISEGSLPGFTSDYNAVISRFTTGGSVLSLSQWRAATGQDAHSFVAAPSQLFVNPAGFDFQLSAGSPAVDAGSSLLAPLVDLSGAARPSGADFDIGAFERLAAAPNQPPVAANDNVSTAWGVAVDINVLANDADFEGAALSIGAFTQPAHGVVTQVLAGQLRYLPNANFSGVDAFAYQDSDGSQLSSFATVTVTVTSPPTNGPVASYRFEETSGTTAADASGNGQSAAYVNQPSLGQPGIGGNAASFNGVDQYVALPAAPFGEAHAGDFALSFETWFRAEPGSSGVVLSQAIATAQPGGAIPAGYVPVVHLGTDGKLRSTMFWHGDANARLVSPGTATYNDDRWHQVAVTYAGGVETLYLDGLAVGQQTRQQVPYAAAYSYFLGTGQTSLWSAGNGGWHFFRGQLDEAAIYQRALTPAEVAQHFSAASPPGADSAAIYRFDETSGATAADASLNGASGTYVNGPAVGQPGAVAGGTAVSLNGISQYVALPDAPFGAFGGPLTFETWFNAPAGASGTILGQVGGGTAIGGPGDRGYVPAVHLGVDGRIRSSLFWHGSASQRLVSPVGTVFNDGQWHHVAVTYADSVETLYLDGVPVGQQSVNQIAYAADYDYYLGVGLTGLWDGGNNGWHYFRGRLDEAKLYQRALTAAEVSQNHSAGFGVGD